MTLSANFQGATDAGTTAVSRWVAFPPPRNDEHTRLRVLAARHPSGASTSALENSEGAGNAGCRPHPRALRAKKVHLRTQATTGQPKQSGIPCAMALRLIRVLPGVPGLLASVARAFVTCRLDPSVGGPGRRDFAVRERSFRRRAQRALNPLASIASRRQRP